MSGVQHLSRIRLICREPERLAAFYQRAFGFVQNGGAALAPFPGLPGATAYIVTLSLGGQKIELVSIQPQGLPYPGDVPGWNSLFQHFAIVVSDMAAAYAKLSALTGWRAISSQGPQVLPASSGGVAAYKFCDPEGHPLELLAFPADAVPERWHKSSASLCLGIDHSAISVADTSRSAAFYRRLGLRRAGGSRNTGLAQDRLDNIEGAAVEVTALEPAEPVPHVELLCYRGFANRESNVPAINDAAATQLVFSVENARALDALCAQNSGALFSGPVPFEEGTARAMMRDPDGHLLCLEA
ncbi:MAG: VOC family protein [Rhodomicrobium sp.]